MSNFYNNYVRLCAEHGYSASGAAAAIGLSNAAANGWKNGKIPNDVTLNKLASLFECEVADLLADSTDEENGLENALEALRNQPGRRMLLSATKGMTEEQVAKMASWLESMMGGNKD